MLTEAWTLESRFSHGGENHPSRETSEDHTSWSAIDVNEDGITLHLTTQWRPHPDQHWPHSNQRPLTNRETTEDFTSWSKWRRMSELSVTTQVTTQTWSAQLSVWFNIEKRTAVLWGNQNAFSCGTDYHPFFDLGKKFSNTALWAKQWK